MDNAYVLLTGVGQLYIAPVGTAFPALGSTPGTSWTALGETQDGVEVELEDKLELIRTDQRTGPVKAARKEETLRIATKLAEHTLENLGNALGVTVTDTPPASGVIGTREVSLYRGGSVAEYALLFVGSSPYFDGPAQYEVPRVVVSKVDKIKYVKDGNAAIPVEFTALEDLSATSASDRFGRLIGQDAAAL